MNFLGDLCSRHFSCAVLSPFLFFVYNSSTAAVAAVEQQ